jgi:hypothetical protein
MKIVVPVRIVLIVVTVVATSVDVEVAGLVIPVMSVKANSVNV